MRPPPRSIAPDVAEGADPGGVGRGEQPEDVVEDAPEDAAGAGHQPLGVDEVPGAALVDDDLGAGEHRGQRAHAAGVVEVDVRDDDRREVAGADAQRGERGLHDRRGRRGARLDQAGPVAADEVGRGDAGVAGHLRVEREDLVAELGGDAVHSVLPLPWLSTGWSVRLSAGR